MKIAIIGAGPSGIIAALTIRKNASDHEVYLFDGNQKTGRKLFATGNGRCNITNMTAGKDSFFSVKPQSLEPVFDQVGPAQIREELDAYGLPTVETEDGWVYPASYSAANVVQILTDNLIYYGVKIYSGTRVTKIRSADHGGFILGAEGCGNLPVFDRLIICTGSKAFPQLGANTTILSELFQFGHRDLPFMPALSPLSAKGMIFKSLQGIRLDAEVTVMEGDAELGRSYGNLIFTDYGLNGPAVMNVSHYVQDERKKYSLKVNFVAHEAKKQIEDAFYSHINRPYLYRSVFLTYLPGKVVEYFFTLWKLDWEITCKSVDSRTFRTHLKRLESGLIPIDGNRGFSFGHVASGGIPLAEVDLRSMESRNRSGLFFAGEVLDVIGPCGGYNLTWAFATGLIAGRNAIREA